MKQQEASEITAPSPPLSGSRPTRGPTSSWSPGDRSLPRSACLAAQAGGVGRKEQARLRQRAQDLLHSFNGVNPLSAMYLTNMGQFGAERSMMHLYHERYGYGTPFASNPPPAYVVGGPNQSFSGVKGDEPGEVDWIRSQPRAKAYADFNYAWPKASWELSENGIYYQAAYIRLLAGVMAGR